MMRSAGKAAGTALIGAAAAAIAASAAQAGELASYSYDARGRLTKVARAMTSSSGAAQSAETNYAYDRADNRLTRSTSGSINVAPTGGAVVLPLDDLIVLPVGR